VRKQVEALEHHADVGAQRVEIGACGSCTGVPCTNTWPPLALFQPVQAAQQRALARARGADHAHDLARMATGAVDAAQHLAGAEALAQAVQRESPRP
jgi:hypothetical protein